MCVFFASSPATTRGIAPAAAAACGRVWHTRDGQRRTLGDSHPDTLGSTFSMAHLYEVQGKLVEAEASYRLALVGYRSVLGDEHSTTKSCLSRLLRLRACALGLPFR
jgi:hypothetical protein